MLSIPDDIWRALYIEFSKDCPETPLTAAKSAFATTCETTDVTHHARRHPALPPAEENLTRASFVCCQQLRCKARFASLITHGTPAYSHMHMVLPLQQHLSCSFGCSYGFTVVMLLLILVHKQALLLPQSLSPLSICG